MFAVPLKLGDPAPPIRLKTDEGNEFDLESRRGKWTVLYFYPKAETPGCTRQACAFRDGNSQLRALGAEVFGICSESVEVLRKFKANRKLNFTLLADPHLAAIRSYGTKFPLIKISKRWTFVVDPDLRIQAIEKKVNPALDAERVAEIIRKLQAGV